ncbi:glycine reductase [Peptostreptococcus russellii]|uniref:glycine/sarcosine/betaine reductase complex component C subunit alpha n=1 Tax=Peptostreptococcus russellii TaxID=215200 RepID=UPI0016278FBB|nr:glycine/sarcosine/betaine reductase complex component C subunit alpha [Peptostreptococcus russellii]MBC2577256.1 glycine reductase [Peptostreptococcus russellii]
MSNKLISDALLELAEAMETGNFGKKIRVGLTTLGSEHGSENLIEGARLANNGMFEIVLIGKGDDDFKSYEVDTEDEMYSKMEELLDAKEIDACVTMHYNFPIGVSTVGRVVAPGKGREMFLATTTGTSATDRVEAMVRNAISGIATAKACGRKKPTVGILNLDGARQVEKILINLKDNGYEFEFAESMRADGGAVMRGNDLLIGVPDVMVTDTLTGNLLMKVFSSFNTGGDFEAQGYGYGPGIGEDYDRRVLILSRASGSPVVANALKYAYDIVKGEVNEVARNEFKSAIKAGLDKEIEAIKAKKAPKETVEEVVAPPKEVVTEAIAGIDILDLEDAVQVLWKESIYAESGMGCTGPVILISEANFAKAEEILKNHDFVK